MPYEKRYYQLLERYQNKDLERRSFLGLLGAAAITAGVGGGITEKLRRYLHAAPLSPIRFDGWGGIVSQAFRDYAFTPYTRKTGIDVVDGLIGNSDEYLARVRLSQPGEHHIVHLGGVFDYARYRDFNLTSVLNEHHIPNLSHVIIALQNLLRRMTNGSLSGVPYDYGTTGLAYNRTYISDDEIREKGAHILIDPSYKNKIGGWNEWKTRIWYGALQTGQDPNHIEEMDRVWDAVRTHRDLALTYWGSGAELMRLLAREEIYVTEGWPGRIKALQDQGYDIGYYDPPGGLGWQECLLVIRGSPMAACEELLNFMLEPAVAIAVAEGQNYPPALDPQMVHLGDKIPQLPAFDPTGTLSKLNFLDPSYWNRHEAEWSQAFGRIRKGY